MKRYSGSRLIGPLASLLLVSSLLFPLVSPAATIDLATGPLTNATPSPVLPNLMFILDNSGSMDWDYTPDWVNDNLCKQTDGDYDRACAGAPPYKSADYNSQYYNPMIYYRPPVDANGISRASQTTWTSVKNDAYNIQDTGSTNLVTQFSDVKWCTNDVDWVYDGGWKQEYTDCLINGNYMLPGKINNKDYVNQQNIYSSGISSVVSGTPDAPSIATRTLGPYYYTITPGEYCDTPDLTNCQFTQNSTFIYPAQVRWCKATTGPTRNASQNAVAESPPPGSCQALRTGSYSAARYPTRFFSPAKAAVPAVAYVAPVAAVARVNPTGFITFSGSTNNTTPTPLINDSLTNSQSIRLGTLDVEPNDISIGRNRSASQAAESVRAAIGTGGTIKAYTGGNSITPSCASKANNVVCLVDTSTTVANGKAVTVGTQTNFNGLSLTVTATAGGVAPVTGVAEVLAQPAIPAQPLTYPGAFVRTDITPGKTYPKVTARTDCTGGVGANGCSYSEEMTNFANWWTYYHTRMQGMKTAASLAFKPIDNRYRVGFITIANQSSNYLPIADFGATQKSAWYTKLFKTNPSTATPLRSALSIVGRIFAGKNPVSGYNSDPAQYSCQQNFALLTTDGYWNTDSNSDVKNITGSASVGNLDGTGTPRPMYEGGTASSNSLADVAKYYYDTDLRTPSLGNCTGSLGVDVCTNNVFVSGTDNNVNQHMTTFTLGLGVDGSLVYTNDYMVATQGDFFDIKTGTKNWSVPAADSERAIDDLWHAAVNGQGIYFSAKNPDQLATSLSDALSSLDSKVGAGAAAAASNLSPVDGDNFSYLASYRTTKWTGNLEGRTIDVTTGKVSQTATWCAEDVVSGSCSAPGAIVAEPSGASNVYNCVTPGATAATCVSPGVLVGTECKVEVPVSCSGTMSTLVGAATDTRAIKMKSGSNLVDFLYINLATAQKAYFDSSTLANLSQWGALNSTQRGVASGANLVHFLRGQTGYENRTSNSEENRLFRYREAALGDAGESTPTFVGKPIFNYLDAGYDLFKAAKAARLGTVYVGLNDGMLHAFDSETGTERWAYVPSMVMPNMWKLADRNYATMHTYYVNGDPITGDICTANCDDVSTAVWRTILVGGLNAGGKGYYALDITDPGSPSLLWEFDTTSDNDLGYTFGNPVITKKANGDWVVLVTSGYNNTTGSNPGKGYLYVLDAMAGTKLSKIGTGVGDATTPSGLARFASSADNPLKNNTTIYTYGGDLLGNIWRFDINSAEASGTNPFLLATLKDASGDSQPVTNRPELGKVSGKSMVFVGTGKYLEATDLTNTQRQTLYAIKDENASTTLENARNHLVQQVLTTDGASRTISNNPVNLATGRGWYVDFPDEGERQHIPAQLVSGSLLVPTVVPEVTVCTPGGYSWFNYFRPGGGAFNSTNVASTKADSVIVGFNVYHIDSDQDGHTSDDPSVVNWVTNKGDQLTCPPDDPDCKFFEESLGAFNNKRGVWRELTQ